MVISKLVAVAVVGVSLVIGGNYLMAQKGADAQSTSAALATSDSIKPESTNGSYNRIVSMDGNLMDRRISLVLPMGSKCNQIFEILNGDDFLLGSLKMTISRAEKTEEIVIFEKGQIGKDWTFKKTPKQQTRGVGFTSAFTLSRPISTAKGDNIRLSLVVEKDIHLKGLKSKITQEIQTSLLIPGVYILEGTYNSLTGPLDAAQAEATLSKTAGMTPEKIQKEIEGLKNVLDCMADIQPKSFKDSIPIRDDNK